MTSTTTNSTTTVIVSNRLLLDPNITPKPFNSEALMFESNLAKEKDELEIEEILNEFESLSNEFQIWSLSRIKKENKFRDESLNRGSEEIREEENKQEAKRGSLAIFIDNFKNAFQLLSS